MFQICTIQYYNRQPHHDYGAPEMCLVLLSNSVFNLTLINFNLNIHMCLLATVLDNAVLFPS